MKLKVLEGVPTKTPVCNYSCNILEKDTNTVRRIGKFYWHTQVKKSSKGKDRSTARQGIYNCSYYSRNHIDQESYKRVLFQLWVEK